MIRDINNKDIDVINKLGSIYDNNFKNLYKLSEYLDNNIYLLKCFEENEIIKGFIIATKMYETVEILLVFVKEEYRQKGIAFKLINSLITKEAKDILLEVAIQNKPAINLYQKLGFEIIDTRKKYYQGIDAYVMKKEVL